MSILLVCAAIGAAQAPPSHYISGAKALPVDQSCLRQVPCAATATLNRPPCWGGLWSVSIGWREWREKALVRRKNQRGRAYGPPRSSAPLLSSIYWSPPPSEVRFAARRPCQGRGMSGGRPAQTAAAPCRPTDPITDCRSGGGWNGVQLRLGATGNRADQPVGPISVESSQKRRNGAADRLDRRQPKGAGPGAGPILHAQPVHHSKRLKR